MFPRPLPWSAATLDEDIRPRPARLDRPDPRRQVAHFTDPLTRMLLASDGFTTPVLEALLGTSLHVRVLRQDLVSAADIPLDVAALLRLGGRGEALLRRSCMMDPDLSLVSLNDVIATVPTADGRLYGDITSLNTPIGYSLLGRGVSQRREIVHVGRSTWRSGGVSRPCAVKAYVMLIDDEPWCYIRERFNPQHVPSTVINSAAGPAAERSMIPGQGDPVTPGSGEVTLSSGGSVTSCHGESVTSCPPGNEPTVRHSLSRRSGGLPRTSRLGLSPPNWTRASSGFVSFRHSSVPMNAGRSLLNWPAR